MSVYIVVFLYLLVSAVYSSKSHSGRIFLKYNYIIECIVLIFLFGIRYRIGGDTTRYEDAYQYIPNISNLEIDVFTLVKYQPMWLVLNSLVKTIGGGFIALQLIQSAFVNGIVFYVIQKKCSYKYFCVVLYFLLYYQYFTTEIMREAMAISIFLLSFDFLLSGKYLKYYVLAILAVLFHVSAVVLLIVPFFKIFERKNYNIVVLSTLVLISATLIWVIFLFLVGRISIYIEYLEQISDTYLDRENNVFGIISSFLFYALPYIVVLSYIDTSKIDNTYENRFILISIIIVKALAISCSPLSRFSNYFVIFALIVIVNLMGHIKVSHKKMAVTLCVIVLIYNQFSFYFKDYSMYTGGKKSHYYNLFIPYSSYLDPQEDNLREEIVWGQEHLKYIK